MAGRSIKQVKNYTIVQANDLIRNKKDFSLWELRVFALLASQVKKEDDDFHTYKFKIKDILDLFETKSNNLYDEIRQIPEKLHSKLIRIPYVDEKGKERMRRYNLVSMSDVPNAEDMDEGDYIMLRFDKDLKDLMLKLGEHFTVYKFYNILKLRSPYIFQLYELLKSEEYKGGGKINIELQEFRDILQIPKSYKYGNIRQRILEPAKEQFEKHTDITFEYEPIKGRGGRMRKLRFWVHKNRKLETDENPIDDFIDLRGDTYEGESPLFRELYPEVKKWIGEDTLRKWLKDYPEEQVKAAISYTKGRIESGEKITNVGGYLFALVKQTILFDPVKADKTKQVKKKKKLKEAKDLKKQLEEKRRQILTDYQVAQEAIISAILVANPETKTQVFEALKTSRLSSYNKDKTIAENLENPMLRAAFQNMIKKQFPEKFTELDKEYQPKIEEIKMALLRV